LSIGAHWSCGSASCSAWLRCRPQLHPVRLSRRSGSKGLSKVDMAARSSVVPARSTGIRPRVSNGRANPPVWRGRDFLSRSGLRGRKPRSIAGLLAMRGIFEHSDGRAAGRRRRRRAASAAHLSLGKAGAAHGFGASSRIPPATPPAATRRRADFASASAGWERPHPPPGSGMTFAEPGADTCCDWEVAMKRREFLKSITALAAGSVQPAAPAIWSPAKAQSRQETLLIVSESGPNNIDIHGVGTNVPGYEVSWNCYDRLISHEMKTLPNGAQYYER